VVKHVLSAVDLFTVRGLLQPVAHHVLPQPLDGHWELDQVGMFTVIVIKLKLGPLSAAIAVPVY
jgi:hypothetical protein